MLLHLVLSLGAMAQQPPPIYGGIEASAEEAPWTVALVARGATSEDDEVVCGGVLIAPDVVLTAAHCTITADEVLAGDPDLRTDVARRALGEVRRHPSWRDDNGLDVAVISLDRPLSDIPLAPLNLGCDIALPEDDDAVNVYGWGATTAEGTGGSDRLLVARLRITDARCTTTDGCRDGVPDGSELFAIGDAQDACIGDSGGPLVDDEGRVIGLVARGATTGPACGEGGVYTRVDAIEAWLLEQLGELPGQDRCGGGCGCASGGGTGAWLWLGALGLIRRRERS